MKKGLFIFLLAATTACLHAQTPHDTVGDAWIVNEWGNLIALRHSNEYELAQYLNTSTRICRCLLAQQGFCDASDDTIMLHKGDSLIIDYGAKLRPDSLSGVGKFICDQLDNNLDKYLFSNYWIGKGDVEFSISQFAGILLCLKHTPNTPLPIIDSLPTGSDTIPCVVSFYNTHYEQSLGSATVLVNSDNQIVGFSDFYNFDPKKWGARPAQYECYVRFVSLFSPPSASAFNIQFDNRHE